jgi:urate oxidase
VSSTLGANSYGKSGIRLFHVARDGDRHEVADLTVAVALEGDFETAHTVGDNAGILATDTMKNTVYAMARTHGVGEPEEFGLLLARHFLGAVAHVSRVRISIQQHVWERMSVGGHEHTHSFRKAGEEKRLAFVTATRASETVEAGVEDLVVLKTTGSAFTGYIRDPFTTLPETTDRIMATAIRAVWTLSRSDADHGSVFAAARTALLDVFADHPSESVQHTLYAMGDEVLNRCPDVTEVRFSLPNKHHLLANLAPFGLDNPNVVFVPTTEPYGLIEATVRRAE